jgi:hypothetical protein
MSRAVVKSSETLHRPAEIERKQIESHEKRVNANRPCQYRAESPSSMSIGDARRSREGLHHPIGVKFIVTGRFDWDAHKNKRINHQKYQSERPQGERPH